MEDITHSFDSRVKQVFDILGGSNWSLKKPEQSSLGKGLDSSDDEDAPDQQPVMAMNDIYSDGEEGQDTCRHSMKATAAFRRAFEAEEEEDVFDVIATGTMDTRRTEKRPPGCMEVLHGNALDRLHGMYEEEGEEQEQGEKEQDKSSAVQREAEPDMHAQAVQPESTSSGRQAKRVKFSADVCGGADEDKECGPRSERGWQRPPGGRVREWDQGKASGAEGQQCRGASRPRPANRGPRLDWQRPGFVPDHVRNPDKYTVYTLDEEVMVGAGERLARAGRAAAAERGDEAAARAPGEEGVLRPAVASMTSGDYASDDTPTATALAAPPAGSIQFRPRRPPAAAKDSSEAVNTTMSRPNVTAAVAAADLDSDGDGEGHEAMHAGSLQGATAGATGSEAGAKRQRHYRGRREEED